MRTIGRYSPTLHATRVPDTTAAREAQRATDALRAARALDTPTKISLPPLPSPPPTTDDRIRPVGTDEGIWNAAKAAGGIMSLRRPQHPAIKGLEPPPKFVPQQTAPGLFSKAPVSKTESVIDTALDKLGIRSKD